MPTFKDSSQDLVNRIKGDLPGIGSFDPTVFVIKSDGDHEAMRLGKVYELIMTDEDIESGNVPTLNDVLSLFRELIRADPQEAEDDGVLGILFVGVGKVKAVDTRGLDDEVVDKLNAGTINPDTLGIATTVTQAALSIQGMSINKADEDIMQIYACKTDTDGEIIAVDAEPTDLDSICNATPQDNGTFQFGMN